jgi:hypothetical protein
MFAAKTRDVSSACAAHRWNDDPLGGPGRWLESQADKAARRTEPRCDGDVRLRFQAALFERSWTGLQLHFGYVSFILFSAI